MTRADFISQEENVAQLAELLRNPILKVALEIVKSEGFPSLPEAMPGVSYGDQVAAHGAFVTGWAKALRRLEALSIPVSKPMSSIMPNSRLYNEVARRRMVASGQYSQEEIDEIGE